MENSMPTSRAEYDLRLIPPNNFPSFPYANPYNIQLDLMRHLYEVIESRKVAIVESPTGTGKTLSLLCGSLTWLKDEQERAKKGQLASLEESLKGDSNEPAWMLEQTIDAHRQELEAVQKEFSNRLEKARKKEEAMRLRENGRFRKKPKLSHSVQIADDDEDQFLPDEVGDSGDADYSNLSPDVRELLKKYEKRHESLKEPEVEDLTCTKIYYASRTHTQLSQTISELRKTAHGSSTRVVSLGSRKNLCINQELRQKGGDLDEACRELMSEKKGKRCPHMPEPGDEARMLDFRDYVLATPRDIEDLANLGKETNTCPYYGSRKAIAQAELVTLPYNLLLQKNSREVLGIDLKSQVVIVDEAHNLIDTILGIHTVPLNNATLKTALSQLCIYLSKFRNRLSAQNSLHLRRLVLFLTSMDQLCAERTKESGSNATEVMMAVNEFVDALGPRMKDVNLLEVDRYLRESKIARKISGYCDQLAEKAEASIAAHENNGKSTSRRKGQTPPLHAVESFLLGLTNASEDGRVFLSVQPSVQPNGGPVVSLKYQLLNPSRHFEEIVAAARSVVLAGGTMQPISDFHNQLFSYLPSDRFSTFSCGHVIPPGNLKCLVVQKGPRNGQMLFKFGQRGDKELINELGQLMMNLAQIVPDGMVVFFPSYSFLHSVKEAWGTSGLLDRFSGKKTLFYEPQASGDVENVLRDYAAAIRGSTVDQYQSSGTSAKRGALLFAVVGAKLSEGLNFTDELARAVVLVGLPYANLGSVELKERMKYVSELGKRAVRPQDATKNAGPLKDAGQELYENLCMKAVNQSIGRAIRHQSDWASLILVDTRYASPKIRAKLPQWIGKDVVVADKFGQVMKELGSFYRDRRV